MSRRPAACSTAAIVVSLAVVGFAGCGGDRQEGVPPPPIAASKPAAQPQPVEARLQATEPPAPPSESATVSPAPPPPTTPSAAPASTPASSIEGAVPPSPLPDPNAQPQQKLPDPLQAMKDGEARRADYQRRLAEAQVNAQNALTNAETWQRNALAFKNPFLARPELSPEDASAVAGMSGSERVRWSEGKLAEAQAASNAAQKALDDLKKNPPLN